MANNVLQGRISNAQYELMKIFDQDLSEEDMKILKRILQEFKFRRVTQLANQTWEEKGWDEAKVEELLKSHLRIPYEAQQKFLDRKQEIVK